MKVTGSSITSRISGTNAKYVANGTVMPRPAPRKYAWTMRSAWTASDPASTLISLPRCAAYRRIESSMPSPVARTGSGSRVRIREAAFAAWLLKISSSVAAQIAVATVSEATIARLPARSCARVSPKAAISRIDATPSIRSRNTEAIASRPRTFSRVML